ncbi:hypothetical protein [uncultured Tolumonas sp.]|uniref:hypothetical protein n=1 Tax=uncultured Tolumonas sp. TaxID=263765 RepID=UPI002931F472|nr:hypothetical protein [uncultured Tolumonas sp.]
MEEIKITDWISAIASSITTISLVFIILQVYLQKKQTAQDHERSRREKAVDLLQCWFKELDQKSSLARKFAETLSEEVLRSVVNNEEFYVDDNNSNKETISAIFELEIDKVNEKIENGHILIERKYSLQLRWQLITYLNMLESIVSAYVYNVADRELIESEFKYLFAHNNGALRKFRSIVHGSYPCIDIFEQKMIEKNKNKLNEKFKLG